jgi:pectate lyase
MKLAFLPDFWVGPARARRVRGRLLRVTICAAAAFAFHTSPSSSASAAVPTWETPPGWADARGGSGGRVIRVTTLALQGPGSLAAALHANGPRLIVFTVAGEIDLDGKSLLVERPHLTLAGETAPSPGVTIKNGGLEINATDVIVRHIKIRPGAGSRQRQSGWEVDGLAMGGDAHDVIVDHCSISWSTDENVSASGRRFAGATPDEWRKNTAHRITFSHCIIGEALYDSTHRKGRHSMGALLHDNTSDIAIIGNLYISNNARNPLFKGGARGAVVNNLICNPGNRVMSFGLVPHEWIGRPWQSGALVIVGNVARKGVSTAADVAFLEVRGPCELYLHDNLFSDVRGNALSVAPVFRLAQLPPIKIKPPANSPILNQPMFWPPRLQARPASETAAWVLANAGARPWDRDAVDRRLVDEAKNGGGKLIDFESEVSGYDAGKTPGLKQEARKPRVE